MTVTWFFDVYHCHFDSLSLLLQSYMEKYFRTEILQKRETTNLLVIKLEFYSIAPYSF